MELFSSWTGSDFVLFYIVLLGLAGVAAWWIPANLRDPGRRAAVDDLESVAILVGGTARLADSLLAELFVRGGVGAGVQGRLAVLDAGAAASPAGQALVTGAGPLSLGTARKALAAHAERIAARLQRAGLLMRPEAQFRLRLLSITPFLALLLLGLYRQRAGHALGEPTGYLVILMVLTAVLATIRFFRSDPRTMAGIAAVEQLRRASARLSRAPRFDEAALAVALFGTAVLVGTPWEPLHAMRQQGGDGGGSADGGSSSSDGDGGGGCGGCGG